MFPTSGPYGVPLASSAIRDSLRAAAREAIFLVRLRMWRSVIFFAGGAGLDILQRRSGFVSLGDGAGVQTQRQCTSSLNCIPENVYGSETRKVSGSPWLRPRETRSIDRI